MAEKPRDKVRRLVGEGVPVAAAARAAGLSRAAARRALEVRAGTPYSGDQNAPKIPPPDYNADQPPVQGDPTFRAGYHDHSYKAYAAPTFFGDFTLDRARAAIEQHDQGLFFESSRLAIAMTRFAPVFAALGIRCAPVISLPRIITGGKKGLAKLVAAEVEAQLAPSKGLLPSPHFPATLWGAIEWNLAQMGFAVLQHVYGTPDDRGVRRIFTRLWPSWAVVYYRYRKTYQVLTTEGPIDVLNDGKFTLIGKTDEPHFQGAIRALMTPTLDGVQTQQARAQWIDRFSDPKLWATMPEGTGVRSPEGQAMQAAVATIFGPEGRGVMPFGAKLDWMGLDSKAAGPFKDTLESDNAYISAILTGADLSPGSGGVYKSPMFWGIVRATVGDDIAAIVRGLNQGHVYPYVQMNYSAGVERDTARGTWVDPVLSIPLPDPEADARIASYTARRKALTDQITADRAAGVIVTQEHVDKLAEQLDVEGVLLAPAVAAQGEITDKDVENKIVAPDEVRARKGLEPLPNGVGSVDTLAKERTEGKDKTGTKPADADLTTADAQATSADAAVTSAETPPPEPSAPAVAPDTPAS